jgi:hypothetical protein
VKPNRQVLARWFLVVMGLIMTLSPQMVLARRNEDFWAEVGILFYDPDSMPSSGCWFGEFDGSAGIVFSDMVSAGYTSVAAASMLGNLMAESSPNVDPLLLEWGGANNPCRAWPANPGDSGPPYPAPGGNNPQRIENPEIWRAWVNTSQDNSAGGTVFTNKTFCGGAGIAQWTYWNRVRGWQIHADEMGLPASDIRVQVSWLLEEMQQWGIGPETLNGMSLEDATWLILRNFFRPASVENSAWDHPSTPEANEAFNKRLDFAQNAGNGNSSGYCIASGLIAGGMTVTQAEEWLERTGYNNCTGLTSSGGGNCHNDIHSRYALPGHANERFCSFVGPVGSRRNCVGFSTYFIRAHTRPELAQAHQALGSVGDGIDFARITANLNVGTHITTGSEPQPYAVFSQTGSGTFGHTGIVMGVDVERQMMTVIEAGCRPTPIPLGDALSSGYMARAVEYSFARMRERNTVYTYITPFVNVGEF